MVPVSRTRRRFHGFALLLIVLSLLAGLPGQPAAAQGTVPDPLDNTQGNFADGVFQRTAIGSEVSTLTPAPGELADSDGVVQLAPIGTLLPWSKLSQELPVAIAQAGVTSLNGRLYVIGGLKPGGVSSADAYWATVEPTTGSLVDSGSGPWTNTPLPATPMILDNDPTIPANYPACAGPSGTTNPARARPGVASVARDATTGYVYVVGGEINVANCSNISSAVVQRGTVAADGTISWETLTGAPVPSPQAPLDNSVPPTTFSRLLGVDGAATVIAHTRTSGSDRYFLYVIGGKSRYINGLADSFASPEDIFERVLKSVYYTEIDIATGNLKNPTGASGSVWVRDADIDLVIPPNDNEGLWNASASATAVQVGDQLKSAIFLAGGSLDLGTTATNNLNPYVYRADVGANGALTWAAGPGTIGPDQVTIEARRGMASLTYNSKLYLIGGRTNNTDGSGLDRVPTAIFDDNLNVIKPDPAGGDFFVGTTDRVLETDAGADLGRYNLGAALVRAEPPSGPIVGTLNSSWAYAIGGNNNSGAPTSTIFLGKIGGAEASEARRAPDGWYYSGVIKTSFVVGEGSAASNKLARVVSLHWATDIDRNANPNADIKLEFRKTITGSGECVDESVFSPSAASDQWRGPIDGFAGSPFDSRTAANGALYNSVNMSDIFPDEVINASCIQYRVHFFQNVDGTGASTPSNSPKLLSVYIQKVTAGNADVNVPEGGFDVRTTNNRLTSLSMTIQNLSIEDPTQTLSLSEALAAVKLPSDGSFFVDLCIARGELGQPAPSLTLPDPAANFPTANGTTCPYYAQVYVAELPKNGSVDLSAPNVPAAHGGGSRWFRNAGDTAVADIREAFSQTGNYQVGIVLDSTTLIPEGAVGETNNKSVVDSFTIEGPPLTVLYLPQVQR